MISNINARKKQIIKTIMERTQIFKARRCDVLGFDSMSYQYLTTKDSMPGMSLYNSRSREVCMESTNTRHVHMIPGLEKCVLER